MPPGRAAPIAKMRSGPGVRRSSGSRSGGVLRVSRPCTPISTDRRPFCNASLNVRPMAIGRTFNEALQKGLRSLEIGVHGLETRNTPPERLPELLRTPGPDRIFAIGAALPGGMTVVEIYA